METRDAMKCVQQWLSQESLEFKTLSDSRAEMHLHVRYPPTRNGHLFNIVIPKKRSLVIVGSVTRVDTGQQEEMQSHSESDPVALEEWLHEARLGLIKGGFDWTLHIGRKSENSGPLQAFNISRPIWFDGLNQHLFMDTLRTIWVSKLAIIHEIRFNYGVGEGKPGPVDDWENKQQDPNSEKAPEIEIKDEMSFGSSFDVDEWV